MQDRWQVRVTAHSRNEADVFVRKHKLRVGPPIQFDSEYAGITALEQMLGAVGADLCATLMTRARRHRLEIDGVEAVVEGRLENPLAFLDVVGEQGTPALRALAIKVFVNTLHTPQELQTAWDEALRLSPLMGCLKDAMKVDLYFKVAV
ncbi:MAG: OsmC family protein [Planctomycetes bacterium]|nr:OsmC family protein [Planctomycetota bacterium]